VRLCCSTELGYMKPLAGYYQLSASVDGTGTNARFTSVNYISFSAPTSIIHVADYAGHGVRSVTTSGTEVFRISVDCFLAT
jgi:hypothetical protein